MPFIWLAPFLVVIICDKIGVRRSLFDRYSDKEALEAIEAAEGLLKAPMMSPIVQDLLNEISRDAKQYANNPGEWLEKNAEKVDEAEKIERTIGTQATNYLL
ncbi:hypothetical protein [Thermoflavimicrobium dichotomicum]|uniref:hypothetical protein n=1 Tax=Thermoflavimicrobium dichotomicum TaxID=46223 RepID=UPI000B892E16|nr:hypothetical protein [Thermoflavimicrobium dichotomicum]